MMKSTIKSQDNRTNTAKVLAINSVIFIFALLMVSASPVFAAHTPVNTISPDVANCNALGDTFTVNVKNDALSTDDILQVEIYKSLTGISNFVCGAAPSGWTLFSYEDRCIYVTGLNSQYKIAPGKDLNFTFDAVMSSDSCGSSFIVATIDDANPGDRKINNLNVAIDCVLPNIIKTVGYPKLPGVQGVFDWWVTTDTNIHLDASDNTPQCDLGLDYCTWRVNVDGVAGQWTNVTGPSETLSWDFNFVGDSNHQLEVECYDNAGNKKVLTEMDKVDSTPPITTKEFIGPQKILKTEGGVVEWVDGVTQVKLTATDPDHTHQSCNVSVDKTLYLINLATNLGDSYEESCWNPAQSCGDYTRSAPNTECVMNLQEFCVTEMKQEKYSTGWYDCVDAGLPQCSEGAAWKVYRGEPIAKDEESCHVLQYYSIDKLGNTENMNVNCFFVDKTPPYMNKNNGNAIPGAGEQAFMNGNPDGAFHWITTQMPITFTCDDTWDGEAAHPSEGEELHFKVSYGYPGTVTYLTPKYCTEYEGEMEENGYCSIAVNPDTKQFVFKFLEESMHNLEYYCEDAVEKRTEAHTQYYKVEDTPPTITTEIIGPQYYNASEGKMYIDGVTNISVTATDPQPHPIGGVTCDWDYTVSEGGTKIGQGENGRTSPFLINFPEESRHDLTITCRDRLGNTATKTSTYYVDKTKPVTTKTYTGPQYPNPITPQTYPRWINSQTSITLAVDDAGPHKSGIKETKYRVSLVADSKCTNYDSCLGALGSGDWLTYRTPFNIPNQSCHLIEYYSVDNVNKTELTKKQCVYVDTTAPYANKTIGTPNVTKDGNLYITQQTDIKLKCTDPAPHPVDHSTLYYRYRNSTECSGLGNAPWNPWVTHSHENTDADRTITFPEDSCHELEYYCKDSLGNEGVHKTEIDIVDTVAPTITTTIVGPSSGDCTTPGTVINNVCPLGTAGCTIPPQRNCFIDGVTKIHVEAVDPTPHPVGGVKCDWSYTVRENESARGGQTGVSAPFDINFPEESTHDLTITCKDELKNSATKYENYQVDKTPPTTTSDYEGPQYNNGTSEWISSATKIDLNVYDNGTHKSGIKETKYRITRLGAGDENNAPCLSNNVCQQQNGTGVWNTYIGTPFNINQESCHLIEYQSIDNVNKTETIKKECVFVDNTAPLPVKTVGKPGSALNNGTREYNFTYYPEVNGRCWNGQEDSIDCWKVTTMTPITLDCNDQLPHPVNHNKVWFQVDFDNESITQTYCQNLQGSFNTDSGYCLLTGRQAPVTFYFGEESEHNLKYYCEDALGNAGPVDDEKFKVEGTAFNITLNKKWNLISVPFVMLDGSIDETFKDVASTVESVWTYDGETGEWYVYTPGPAPDTLTEMKPGWGYWVKSYNASTLVIGGSLFSPAKTPPDKNLVKGWNLIGYYDNRDMNGNTILSYEGPYGDGRYAIDALQSLVNTVEGHPKWSSLVSYWEPYNTDGNPNTNLWVYLSQYSRMDPGAGYWIEIDENDIYTFSTNCAYWWCYD